MKWHTHVLLGLLAILLVTLFFGALIYIARAPSLPTARLICLKEVADTISDCSNKITEKSNQCLISVGVLHQYCPSRWTDEMCEENAEERASRCIINHTWETRGCLNNAAIEHQQCMFGFYPSRELIETRRGRGGTRVSHFKF